VGWTLAWRATSAVATLVLGSVLAHTLSPAEYGRYTLVLSVLVYIALLATFGQDQGLLRYLPEVLTRDDRTAAYDLLRKSATSILLVWAAVSAIVWILRPQIDQALRAQVADLLALGTVLLLTGIAAGVMSFALVAIYDMRSQALATPIAGAVTVVLAILFLRRGGHLGSVLVAGAIGQASLALFYFLVLRRAIERRTGPAGSRIGWRRLLVYASGWLPSLLIASAVGLQFESLFLTRFWGTAQVAYYDTGYNIPQRLVALIPSLLTGAWVVGTLEQARGEAGRLRAAVVAFYKGILLIAFPLAFGAGALLRPVIPLVYTHKLAPAADIAPVLLACFILVLLVAPWGLVVRVRELAWINALINIAQVGFAAVMDLLLIRAFGLWGAVAAVALTSILTVGLTLGIWYWADRPSLAVPWRYGVRCLLAALPIAGLLPLAWAGFRLPLLLAAAVVTTLAWLVLVRELRLLDADEVPLLHQSRHAPIRFALRYLAS
jgi:O-antigen/teichoic acid export membrane protein